MPERCELLAQIEGSDLSIISEHVKRQERFMSSIAVLVEGLQADSIRNAVFKAANSSISTGIYDAWQKVVSDRFFRADAHVEVSDAAKALYWDISMYGLPSVSSTSRKLAKCSLDEPAVTEMRKFVAAALPLACAAKYLRSKVVKGRAPSTRPAKPENPNKVVRTCPCCFRKVAVVNGTMAHHGYERPGGGFQTASCPGIKFQPLERSNEGLVWLISHTRSLLSKARVLFEGRHTVDRLPYRIGFSKVEMVHKVDDRWTRVFGSYEGRLSAEIRQLDSTIKDLTAKLDSWTQTEPETDDNG